MRKHDTFDTDEVLAAESHGAKFHRHANGDWIVLDQPGDSVLWWAYFKSKERAAQGYCAMYGLKP